MHRTEKVALKEEIKKIKSELQMCMRLTLHFNFHQIWVGGEDDHLCLLAIKIDVATPSTWLIWLMLPPSYMPCPLRPGICHNHQCLLQHDHRATKPPKPHCLTWLGKKHLRLSERWTRGSSNTGERWGHTCFFKWCLIIQKWVGSRSAYSIQHPSAAETLAKPHWPINGWSYATTCVLCH